MIKIFEDIRSYADNKYWDFTISRKMRIKDPNYFGESSDRIAEDLYDFFNSLIAKEFALNESWVSNNTLESHFKKHCIGDTNKKSERTNIYYDFTTVDELEDYENVVLTDILNTDNKIVSLYDTKEVYSALSKITTQPCSILFDAPCGFTNISGDIKIGLNSFANDVTTNYEGNTINLSIISKTNKTISMFAVDADLIETRIKRIIRSQANDKEVRKLYGGN